MSTPLGFHSFSEERRVAAQLAAKTDPELIQLRNTLRRTLTFGRRMEDPLWNALLVEMEKRGWPD